MKTSIKIIITTLLISLTFIEAKAQYPGTNLRGRVMTNGYYGQSPLTYASVDLYYYRRSNNQWVKLQSTVTDAYGFYYFNYVKHNLDYVIQIGRHSNYNIHVNWINYNYYQYQDLPIFYY